MIDQERILHAIYVAVDKLNNQLPNGTKLEKSPDAVLYGTSGVLESLDFVTFIMEIEEQIQKEFGVDLMITDENLLSKEKSPFSTLGTLTDYLVDVLKEQESNAT
jgi:acyl carrier protein